MRDVYDHDTIIVDTDGWKLPERSRTSTEDLTVQVMVNSTWHRQFIGKPKTACNEPYHSQFAPLRRESLTGPLCQEGCFTIFELAKSDELNTATKAEEE